MNVDWQQLKTLIGNGKSTENAEKAVQKSQNNNIKRRFGCIKRGLRGDN